MNEPTTLPKTPWYEVVTGDLLEQGDLIKNCPALEFPPKFRFNVTTPNESVNVVPKLWNVAVLTQSCDLENKDLNQVLVCPYRSLSDALELLQKDQRDSKKARDAFFEQIRRGYQHSLHMLAACEEDNFQQDFQILDFRQVFTIPFDLLTYCAKQNEQRLRLNSPYREHLAQAFARFFMRVGLPIDIPSFR